MINLLKFYIQNKTLDLLEEEENCKIKQEPIDQEIEFSDDELNWDDLII